MTLLSLFCIHLFIHPIYSTGDVFGSDSIQIVNDPEGVLVDVDGCRDLFRYQLAGNRKLRFEPMNNPAYFFHGQCIATSGFFEPAVRIKERFFQSELFVPQPVITSRSCQLNLCLGGGGFNCIAVSDEYIYIYIYTSLPVLYKRLFIYI